MADSAPPTDAATAGTPTGDEAAGLDANSLMDQLQAWFTVDMAIKAALFIGILIVAKIIGSIIAKSISKGFEKSKRQPSALFKAFVTTWSARAVFILGLVVALETVGVRTAPIIAGLGVAGFILGFAIQGTLSNFASGIMLLIYQPFDIGDVVEVGGTIGKVTELSIVNTTLTTGDNRVVIAPNTNVWGSTIISVTKNPSRRVDMTISVGYDADLDQVKQLVTEHIKANPKVLPDPAPVVEVGAWGESSIDFIARPWCNTADYWTVLWELQLSIKKLLDEHDIDIPFPQRVVHMRNPVAA